MNKKVNNFLSQYIKIQGLFQGPTKIKDFVKDLQNSRIFQGLFKDLQISRTFQGPYEPCKGDIDPPLPSNASNLLIRPCNGLTETCYALEIV